MIQRKLADMAARAYAAETMSYRTAGLVYRAIEAAKARGAASREQRLETLSEFSAECALAKVYASEAYNGLADEAVQVFGGYGFSEEYKPARMYRDSRISRIYEGTNEICRLYAQRTIFKHLSEGSGEGGALRRGLEGLKQLRSIGRLTEGRGLTREDASAEEEAVAGLKQIYFGLVRDVVTGVGPEGLKDPNRQQFLASLADVAMETFAAESVVLRAAKLGERGGEEEGGARADLSTLVLQRSAERVRTEASTVLAELHEGRALDRRLEEVLALLPRPLPLVEVRRRVSERLVEVGGLLPGETG